MRVRLNLRGRNRFVLLTRRHALKFPSLRSWTDFLYGLLNNMTEARIAREGHPDVCPVLWAAPGGWLVVMPRLPIVTEAGWLAMEGEAHAWAPGVQVESKPDSWGLYNGRLVAVDYGWQG